jgi:predicted 3-demethylubiquinone-9 3-methyltransferase (glyoxalase superfamily)
MIHKVTPFLWFEKQAEEAARFYVSLFPGSQVGAVTRSQADSPSGPAGGVLTVAFTLAGVPFVALNGGPHFRLTEAFSVQVSCPDQAEVDRLWAALTAGSRATAAGSRTAGGSRGR